MTDGYISIKLGSENKTAHFGMNFIKILRDDCGYTLTEIGEELQQSDELDRFIAFSKLLYSGFKAFDVQNNNIIDYNEEKCLEWALTLHGDQINDFQGVMMYATALNETLSKMGKQKREKTPQKS